MIDSFDVHRRAYSFDPIQKEHTQNDHHKTLGKEQGTIHFGALCRIAAAARRTVLIKN